MNYRNCIIVTLTILITLILSGIVVAEEPMEPLFADGVTGTGWAGALAGFWYPDFEQLNPLLSGANFRTPVPIIYGGAEGGIVPGFTVGGFGGGNIIREGNAQLNVGFGGLSFNRTYPFSDGHVYYGGLIGGGGAELVVQNNPDPDPSTVGDAVGSAQQTVLRTGFFLVGPQVGLQLPVTPFIQFKANAGYLLTVGGDWEMLGDSELSGGKVNWGGPMLQVGFVFGGSGNPEIPPPPVPKTTNL